MTDQTWSPTIFSQVPWEAWYQALSYNQTNNDSHRLTHVIYYNIDLKTVNCKSVLKMSFNLVF